MQATGRIKKNRICYSLLGMAGFSVRARTGVVSYDGTELPAGEALLVVTAKHRKGNVDDADVTITVSVTAAETEPLLQRQADSLPLNKGPLGQSAIVDPDSSKTLRVHATTTRPMIGRGKFYCQGRLVTFTANKSVHWRATGGDGLGAFRLRAIDDDTGYFAEGNNPKRQRAILSHNACTDEAVWDGFTLKVIADRDTNRNNDNHKELTIKPIRIGFDDPSSD